MNKKNKVAIGIGGSLIVLIIGIICFLVGGYLAGWDIIGWLTSGQAYFVYGLLIIILISLVGLLIYNKVMKK